jgi:aspartokinase-like uncharacterized kinase
MRGTDAGLAVVKVGGSLYDLDDLGDRLRGWLAGLPARDVLLVPGGGPTADAVRELDRRHRLGEEAAHWLALHALTVNAHFLLTLLPGARLVDVYRSRPEGLTVLDGEAFATADKGRAGCLPHCWEATSDSVAARAAVVAGADDLILLKSADVTEGIDWDTAAGLGLVDCVFASVLKQAPALRVTAVNLRRWRPPGAG